MSLIPVFKIGLWNAWIFMLYIVFGAAFFLRLAKEKDVPNPSEVELSKTKMSLCIFSKVIIVPAVIYSVFLPLKLGTTLNQKSFGQVFNLSSLFLTWDEIANIIVEEVGNGKVKIVSQEVWKGSSFLAGEWNLSLQKAERFLGFKLELRESDYRVLFKEAIRGVVDKLRSA